MNSIFCITPYLENGVLMFDDEKRGILREPFVADADIALLKAAELAGADPKRFNLLFSDFAFPGNQFAAHFRYSDSMDYGGDHYRVFLGENKIDAWLCPRLRIYYPTPPLEIYFQIKAV